MSPVILHLVVSCKEDGSIVIINVGDKVGKSENNVVGSKVSYEGEMLVGVIDEDPAREGVLDDGGGEPTSKVVGDE